jgi:HK97 gp10 family phage protein
MFDMEFKLSGAELVLSRMKAAGHEISYKGGRSALRKSANLIADKARENAQLLDDPETAEQIVKNVAVRWSTKRFKQTGDLAFRVGILGGAGSRQKGKPGPGGETRYWRMLEFGTRKMAAQPFMRPALEQNQQEAADVFIKEAYKAIGRAMKRAAKGK